MAPLISWDFPPLFSYPCISWATLAVDSFLRPKDYPKTLHISLTLSFQSLENNQEWIPRTFPSDSPVCPTTDTCPFRPRRICWVPTPPPPPVRRKASPAAGRLWALWDLGASMPRAWACPSRRLMRTSQDPVLPTSLWAPPPSPSRPSVGAPPRWRCRVAPEAVVGLGQGAPTEGSRRTGRGRPWGWTSMPGSGGECTIWTMPWMNWGAWFPMPTPRPWGSCPR